MKGCAGFNPAALLLSGANSTPIKAFYTLDAILSPGLITSSLMIEQTFNIAGILLGDIITVNKTTSQNGLGICGSRVVSDGVVGITFLNMLLISITPTANEVYKISGMR